MKWAFQEQGYSYFQCSEKALEGLKKATGTIKNNNLAERLGIAANTIQNWRIRGKIPSHIYEKVNVDPEEDVLSVRLYDVAESAGAGS